MRCENSLVRKASGRVRTVLVLLGHVGARVDELLRHAGVAVVGRPHQRRRAVGLPRAVDVGARLEQVAHAARVAVLRRHEERRHAVRVALVQRRALVDERLHVLVPPVEGGHDQPLVDVRLRVVHALERSRVVLLGLLLVVIRRDHENAAAQRRQDQQAQRGARHRRAAFFGVRCLEPPRQRTGRCVRGLI